MQEYVLGFLFSEDKQQVALIYKNRPVSLKNQWNGIGGHIEENETADKAIIREFYEETGVQIESWNDPFCVVQNKIFICTFFVHFLI
jgi:8-oxo-dGTP pyrophosphatase MutT (NUDIX family)